MWKKKKNLFRATCKKNYKFSERGMHMYKTLKNFEAKERVFKISKRAMAPFPFSSSPHDKYKKPCICRYGKICF